MKVSCFYIGNPMEARPVKAAQKGHMVLTVGAVDFNGVLGPILGLADWLCVGVIMFAGASWMLGNRTKAIEHIIGGASGYLIIRHAVDIKNFLRAL